MPIREEAFRIGCGRYLQKPGILSALGEEVLRLGTAPLAICGKTALEITHSKIESSLKNSCKRYEIVTHSGTCNEERAKELAAYATDNGFDVIIGVGGGVIMDFAKLIAYHAGVPVINVPTSSATCAAYTPLSVCYTKEGHTIGTKHFANEVNAVLADSEVISTQPVRLLLSGIFDALAKFVEIKQRFNENTIDFPLGLDWAFVLSQHSFAQLNALTEQCIADTRDGKISQAVERVIFTSIAVTGVISGIARGSNQTALAHKFYENSRVLFFDECKPYLHGEIVGIGLLLQNIFNGEEENNKKLTELMKKHNMPHSIRDIGIDPSEASLNKYYDRICNSSAISKDNTDECKRFMESLRAFWSI